MKNDLVTMLDLFEADGIIDKVSAAAIRTAASAMRLPRPIMNWTYGIGYFLNFMIPIYTDYMRAVTENQSGYHVFVYSYSRHSNCERKFTSQELIDLVKKHSKDLRFNPEYTTGIIKVSSLNSNNEIYNSVASPRNRNIAILWYYGYSAEVIAKTYGITKGRVSEIVNHMNRVYGRITKAFSDGNEDSIERLLALPGAVKCNLVHNNNIVTISELERVVNEGKATDLKGISDKSEYLIRQALYAYYKLEGKECNIHE